MMPTEIKVALIALIGVIFTAVASIITQVVLTKRGQEKMLTSMMESIKHQSELDDQRLDAKLEKHQAVTDVKIDELTREVRAHNNFAQRMPVVEERIDAINHRIEALEHKAE